MKKIHSLNLKRKDNIFAFMVSLPAVLMTALFILIPVLDSVFISFQNFKIVNIIKKTPGLWNNFKNYIDLFKGEKIFSSITITFSFVIFVVLCTFIIGFGFALLLNSRIRGARLIRSVMMVPWVVPTVISALLWMWIYQPQYGVLKYLVSVLSLGKITDFAMLNNMDTALIGIGISALWKQIPLMTLLLLAGLQNVPDELLEAASLDGASYFRRLIHVIIPYMRSVISISVSMCIIENFKQFPLFWTMTGGGPNGATTSLAVLSYREAFVSNDLGAGAAITTIWMLIMIIVVVVFRKVFKPNVDV